MGQRKPPKLIELLGAALLQLPTLDEQGKPVLDADGRIVPLIDREHAKLMAPEQIKSLFHFDHYPIHHALGGSNHPTNLVPRLIKAHREKTAKIDQPLLAKVDRVAQKHAEFRARMLAKTASDPSAEPLMKAKPKSKWGKRRLESKNTFKDRRPREGT